MVCFSLKYWYVVSCYFLKCNFHIIISIFTIQFIHISHLGKYCRKTEPNWNHCIYFTWERILRKIRFISSNIRDSAKRKPNRLLESQNQNWISGNWAQSNIAPNRRKSLQSNLENAYAYSAFQEIRVRPNGNTHWNVIGICRYFDGWERMRPIAQLPFASSVVGSQRRIKRQYNGVMATLANSALLVL